MQKQFTPCPACGAVGEVGTKCQFCNTTIALKEGGISSSERIPPRRMVTPQQYAEKISIYHKVEPAGNILIVSIGEEYGVINLNGDLIYPLGSDKIQRGLGNTIKLGFTYEETLTEASTSWDKFDEEWKHKEAETFERFITKKYFNLETGIYADELGFVEDKENPKKLYRVDVNNEWKPINTYTNLEGEVHSYDYAEQVVIQHEDYYSRSRNMYLLHQGDKCSLWIVYDEKIDKKYFDEIKLPFEEEQNAMKGAPTSPMCVLEELNGDYEIKSSNTRLQIVLRTIKDVDIVLTIASKKDKAEWRYARSDFWPSDFHDFDEIYNEWRLKRILNGISVNSTLLHPIQSYVKRIKEDRYYEESLQVHFFNDMIFFIENNNAERDFLPSEDGVSLTTVEDIMNEQQWRILKKDKIYELFNNSETYANIFINFGMDAVTLCATIQYLARCYNCPIEKVKILNSGSEKSEEEEKERTLNPVNIILAILSFAMASIPIIVGEYTIKGFIVFLFFLFCGIVFIKKRYI